MCLNFVTWWWLVRINNLYPAWNSTIIPKSADMLRSRYVIFPKLKPKHSICNSPRFRTEKQVYVIHNFVSNVLNMKLKIPNIQPEILQLFEIQRICYFSRTEAEVLHLQFSSFSNGKTSWMSLVNLQSKEDRHHVIS